MRSMTGFGVGEATLAGGRLMIEARSVNHRFVEVRINLPSELASHGYLLERLVRAQVSRGRFDLTARLLGSALPPPELDVDRARGAFAALARLRDDLAPDQPLPLGILSTVPELFRPAIEPEKNAARQSLEAALAAALEALDAMRLREGEALAQDLSTHVADARTIVATIAERSGEVTAAYRERLQQRVARLLAGTKVEVDSGRIEMEVALLSDRSDVSEELARLACHFDQFEELLDADRPIGRTLEFLLQEMAREANTVASKSPDASLTGRAVDLKAAVERMREQVQNAE